MKTDLSVLIGAGVLVVSLVLVCLTVLTEMQRDAALPSQEGLNSEPKSLSAVN
ncbi:MAG: hypothetical protein KME06_04375 [Kastovskya adunca ATA6-11-RM4]|jgi:hypothetical protein|nr:hypothetical protein [Kastovskya adunca ATA6-11-RM4]